MDEIKNVEFEIVNKKKFDLSDYIECFRENIYSVMFYTVGLIIGAYFYSISENQSLSNLLTSVPKSFLIELTANAIVYFLAWLILFLMGFSIIGFSVMNIIPLSAGIYYGLKSACYFSVYSIKGIGYIALAIAPVSALFLVIIIYSVSYNSILSRSIYDSIKNINKDFKIALKPLLIQIIIQLVLFMALSVINSALSMGMHSIIAI